VEVFLPGLTPSLVRNGLKSYNPMEYTINIKGRLMDLSTPQVMGILNVTPDSFYSGSRKQTEMEIAQRANQIIEEGGSIIDVGAFSTRPGADEVSEEEEGRRLKFALDIVRREQPHAAISVDTYRPTLARKCIEEWGADIINDVSEGGITGIANVPLKQRQEEYPEMFRVVGELKVPYILMSVQPTLAKMMKGFAREVQQLRDLGAKDIILDPGFGFGKNLIQNYQIYDEMEKLNVLELPVLVGISRKSMIYKLLGGDATTSLNGTSVLDTIALMKGASILRVHDVKEAAEAVKIVEAMKEGRV
jgi:dihydropteroate synthase